NWCPVCKTSISDAEVEHEEQDGFFWHINYPVVGEEGRFVEIATTRPETLFGDTAVAVNPDDERYQDIIGKTLKLPCTDREIPVIADSYVDKEFGTGCVKITPAHDPNDFEVGKRHSLEEIVVINDDATMNEKAGKYAGMDRYECRKALVEDLKEQGLLVKVVPHSHNVGVHDRCHTTVEPMIKQQWFVKMDEMIKPAVEGVKNGEIKLLPSRMDKTYFNWTDNIRDWCISRQLWWGHRIPAWYCDDCGEMVVSIEKPGKCPKCGKEHWTQDPDTLDTWFSSALWPFSTLGWPNMDSEDLKTFYPTNVLVTGYDIIFFWVARMIFSGLECMKQKPFSDILIHGIVRDSQGRKMSKSLGNGIDPLEVIDQYSTDALRFSLVLGISAGNDIRYMPEKLEQASNFANKLWNAAKFVLMNLDGVEKLPKLDEIDTAKLAKEDKWIISKLNTLSKEVNENITNYDLGVATQKIYDFIWNEFCDWYIEIVKTRLYGDDKESKLMAQVTLNEVLMNSLKLLHPIMPFITEEIYLQLFNIDESIMISKFPQFDEKYNFKADEEEIEKLKEIIIGIRNLRASSNVHPSKKTELIFVTTKYKYLINQSEGFLKKLGYSENIKVQENKEGIAQNALSIITDGIELYIPFEELVDIEEERKRMEEEKKKVIAEIERASKMLSNPGFVNKAPEAKINEEKAKLEKYQNMLKNLEERLK
ncbi:MAG TPA: valine--tRNA ligase, partial [Clostridiales bacterium]|nr:valine--tRNA ligase [Clostridiales bacterium]